MNSKTSIKTIKQVLKDGTRFLAAKDSENTHLSESEKQLDIGGRARLEAEKLIAFSLGLSRIDIYLNVDKPLTEEELEKLRGYFIDRGKGKPLQYIIGRTYFRYLKLKVNENTLIPRPETESIIDIALNLIKPGVRILDLGTGTGAIALSIAKEAKIKVDACDISSKALEVAKENAEINGIESVNWIESDWFKNIEGQYDLIVCNPPYVSLEEFNNLKVEIREHEPKKAVTDNADGYQCLKKVVNDGSKYLTDKGYLVLEIGSNQRASVLKLLENAAFKNISFKKDLAGKIRFAIGQYA